MANQTVSERAGRAGDTASLPDSPRRIPPSRAAATGAAARLALVLVVLALPLTAASLLSARPGLGGAAIDNPPEQDPPASASSSPAPSSAAPSSPATTPRITYTRTLAGSVPEYMAVIVNSDGAGSYEGRSLKDPQQARPLKLSAATTGRLFALAAALDDFRGQLESHKKVADLGLKTFTYEHGAEKHEVEFNYTTKQTARDLTDLFERIAVVEEHLATLQYALKYDPLSLPQELLRIQIDLEHKALADPELMVPQLQEIANNPRLLHLAQARAQDILKTVNGGQ